MLKCFRKILDWLRQGIPGMILWALGLITAFCLLTFGVFTFIPGSPGINVSKNDIYVPQDQIGEIRIVVEDNSIRGFIFRNVLPRFAPTMQLKISAKQGSVTLSGLPAGPPDRIPLKVRPGDVVTVEYLFETGYEIGHVQVAIYDSFDDVEKDDEAQSETIRFIKTQRRYE